MEGSKEKVASAKLMQYIKELMVKETQLRQECEIDEACLSIRKQLERMLKQFEENIDLSEEMSTKVETDITQLTDAQRMVFLYLFNARGKQLQRWSAMLTEKNMFEYSVNRPIYGDRKSIREYISSKPRSEEHAYLAFKVEKSDVTHDEHSTPSFDSLKHPLLKLKEGALKLANLVSVSHDGKEYRLRSGGLEEFR